MFGCMYLTDNRTWCHTVLLPLKPILILFSIFVVSSTYRYAVMGVFIPLTLSMIISLPTAQTGMQFGFKSYEGIQIV